MTKRSGSDRGSSGKIFLYVMVILLAISGYGVAVAIYGVTLISPVWPILVGLAGGVLTGTLFWKYWIHVSGTSSFYINFLINIVATAGIWAALLLGINMWGARSESGHDEKVVVERRFAETHHRSKRVGRRYVAQGEPYKVYYVEIAMPDDRRKKLSVGYSEYSRICTGDSVTVSVNRGLLGFPLVRDCNSGKSRKNGIH